MSRNYLSANEHRSQIVSNKKEIVFNNRLPPDLEANSKCVDCEEVGHFNKNHYRCKYYKEASADDVGGSNNKRKQSTTINQEKKASKRQKYATENPVGMHCKKCGGDNHNSARSALCPFNILPKAKVLEQNLGSQHYKAFTRKLPLDPCINQPHHHIKNKITQTCAAVRDITFRAKIFVNFYILSNANNDEAYKGI